MAMLVKTLLTLEGIFKKTTLLMGERGIFHEIFSTFSLKKKDITSCVESVELSHPFL